jgi:hypothetical protein
MRNQERIKCKRGTDKPIRVRKVSSMVNSKPAKPKEEK